VRLAAILALAACYSPQYRDCAFTCPENVCPGDLVCELGVCRDAPGRPACTTMPDAPSSDRDGDTIENDVDNCPDIANKNQANEDGDEFGDLCDPCPPVAGGGDQDGDGVGDDCDVSPGADKITLFEGFHEPMPFGTQPTPNCWQFANDEASVNGNSTTFCQLLWPRTLAAGHTSYRITAAMTLMGDEGTTGSARRVGLVDELGALGGNGVLCEYGMGSNNEQTLLLYNAVTATTVASALADAAIGTPAIVKLTFAAGSGYNCSALPVAPLISGPPQSTINSPLIGFQLRAVDATFRWILVVSAP